jgi:hypothetical protein
MALAPDIARAERFWRSKGGKVAQGRLAAVRGSENVRGFEQRTISVAQTSRDIM